MEASAALRGQVLRKVRIPNALPYLFTAPEGRGHAVVIGAVVAEFFGGPLVLGRDLRDLQTGSFE